MTNFIPIFPLELVVYPGEQLNLHIFEPRYKQLIHECYQQKKPFGIPAVLEGRVMDYGTTVEVAAVFKTYDNGEMDVSTRGVAVFKILELIKEVPDKLFSGAIVTYPHNHIAGYTQNMQKLHDNLLLMHQYLQVKKDFDKNAAALVSYDIAHHAGLSLQQEYDLLQLTDERQRQEYLKRHIDAILPTIQQVKALKEKIQMNGHFKSLQGFTL